MGAAQVTGNVGKNRGQSGASLAARQHDMEAKRNAALSPIFQTFSGFFA
jgi:hypothetical protein